MSLNSRSVKKYLAPAGCGFWGNSRTHHHPVITRRPNPTLTSQYRLVGPDELAAGDVDDPDACLGLVKGCRGRGRDGEQRHDPNGGHRDGNGQRNEYPAGSRLGLRQRCAPRRSRRYRRERRWYRPIEALCRRADHS